jgi:hypothetical protein
MEFDVLVLCIREKRETNDVISYPLPPAPRPHRPECRTSTTAVRINRSG